MGKSTVFNQLLKRRPRPAPWLTYYEARRKAATDQLFDNASAKNLLKAATCRIPGLGDIFADAYIRHQAERRFVEDADSPYHQFFNHCLRQIMTATSGHGPHRHQRECLPHLRPAHSLNLAWLFSKLKYLQFLEPMDITVVLDESITHCAVGLINERSTVAEPRECFRPLPPPHKLVHLSAPVDEILDRLMRRSRDETSPRHLDLNQQQLRDKTRRISRLTEIAVSTLQWAGADVLQLDAMEPIEENVRRVEAFLHTD